MTALGFKAQFAGPVERREKCQSIRAKGDRFKVGGAIQLYTGMRTKACRKLVSPDPVCILSNYIVLRPNGITFGTVAEQFPDVDEFARLDGFKDYADMHRWFTERYDDAYFVGRLIRWGAA
jgi:hypothetical protein